MDMAGKQKVSNALPHGYFLLKAAIIVMLVQSIVVSNVIKGLLFPNLFILLQFGKDLFLNFSKKSTQTILCGVSKFILVFGAYQIVVQFLNIIFEPDFFDLIMISFEPSNVFLFRKSLFTQSLYLITCIIFFMYIYDYLQQKGNAESLLRIAKIGIIIYVIFGFYEFFSYLLTGQNINIFSNRITGDNHVSKFLQIVNLGGFKIQRMKSLAGEASMFAYSILPFFILYFHLKDKIYILFLIALILSTATTGVLGLIFFVIVELIFFRKSIKFILILGGVLGMGAIFFYSAVFGFFQFTFEKFSMANVSSIDRFAKMSAHFNYFITSDIFHILFGYGFGYVRSTDGITTMLVNTGLLGTGAFIFFMFYPVIKMKINSNYRQGLAAAILVLVPVIFASVAEFYYFHIWFLAALAWFEYHKDLGVGSDNC